MIIDIHAHPFFPEMLADQPTPPKPSKASQEDNKLDLVADPSSIIDAIVLTSQRYGGSGPCILSLKDFQDQMADAGIDMVAFQVALIKEENARLNNEHVANLIKQFEGRAIGFAGFDPNVGEQAVTDIEYAVKELGFKGIKIVSAILGLDINDKVFYPCYEKAQELGVPIMVHTGTGLIMGCRVKHVNPLMIDDVAFDFPDLKIISAHLGCWNYMDVHSLLVRHPNVYADLSAWPLNPQYMDLVPWSLFEETVPDKILLGSDYPAAQTPKEALETVGRLPISEGFRTKIIGENAVRLLGIQEV